MSTHREVLPGNCISPPPRAKLDPAPCPGKIFERCWEDPDRVISRALFNLCRSQPLYRPRAVFAVGSEPRSAGR